MKFRVGDMVRFLNETGGGKITRVDERGLLNILTDDGFEIPVRENELILQTPLSRGSDTLMPADKFPNRPEKEPEPVHERISKPDLQGTSMPVGVPAGSPVKVLLGLVPDDFEAVFKTSIHCYLINDSEYFLYYMVGYQQQGK